MNKKCVYVNNKELSNDRIFERNMLDSQIFSNNNIPIQINNNNEFNSKNKYLNYNNNLFDNRLTSDIVTHLQPKVGFMNFNKNKENNIKYSENNSNVYNLSTSSSNIFNSVDKLNGIVETNYKNKLNSIKP